MLTKEQARRAKAKANYYRLIKQYPMATRSDRMKKQIAQALKDMYSKKRSTPQSANMQPYTVGGLLMAKGKKKGKSGKKGGYHVTHHVSKMHGDPGGMEGFARQTMSFIGTLALVMFGAAGSSFLANKIPAGMTGSKHLRVFAPAGLGIATHLATPRKWHNITFPIMCGTMAVSGVTGLKTYIPQVPLLAGDANALQVPQYTMGTDAQGRLIDTRDGSLLLDEQGRTLKGDGTPHDENMDGGPGDMLGDSVPGEMLGDDGSVLGDDVSVLGDDIDFS